MRHCTWTGSRGRYLPSGRINSVVAPSRHDEAFALKVTFTFGMQDGEAFLGMREREDRPFFQTALTPMPPIAEYVCSVAPLNVRAAYAALVEKFHELYDEDPEAYAVYNPRTGKGRLRTLTLSTGRAGAEGLLLSFWVAEPVDAEVLCRSWTNSKPARICWSTTYDHVTHVC